MSRRWLTLIALVASTHAQTVLPEGKGKEILDGYCQECHPLEDVVSQSLSADQWRKTVARMVRKGASLKPEQIDTLVGYLATYFGPDTAKPAVNINKADAGELQKTLGIDESEARSITRYREADGRFSNWDDLAKRSGALARKLESKRDIIVFQ